MVYAASITLDVGVRHIWGSIMSKFNIGDRVVDTCPSATTTSKSGVLMEHTEQSLVWVQFDDESLNYMDCAEEFGEGIRCTACRPADLVLESEFNK